AHWHAWTTRVSCAMRSTTRSRHCSGRWQCSRSNTTSSSCGCLRRRSPVSVPRPVRPTVELPPACWRRAGRSAVQVFTLCACLDAMVPMSEPIRLAKRVADLARCSRAEAEQYIEGGWGRVNGDVVEEPQFPVTTQAVEIDPEARRTPTET